MESNPYSSPSANLFGSTTSTSVEGVPNEAIVNLQRTKPWVRFIGVMMWILVAFMLLGGIGVAIAGVMGVGAAMGQAEGETGPGAAGAGAAMIGVAVVYAIMSLIYIYPTVKIWKYGTFIGKLVISRSPEDLVAALDQQRSFWKFVGVMMILTIGLYLVVGVGMAIFGVAMGGFGNIPASTDLVPAQP